MIARGAKSGRRFFLRIGLRAFAYARGLRHSFVAGRARRSGFCAAGERDRNQMERGGRGDRIRFCR